MSKFVNFEVPRTTAGWVPLEESLATLMQRLAGGPYLLGERFSALDALYGTAFAQLLPKAPARAVRGAHRDTAGVRKGAGQGRGLKSRRGPRRAPPAHA
jgi:glutathione S-transferase